MPTPFEEELLAMARAQSREAAQAEAPTPSALPDLSPEMLLSASAQKEFQAARGFFPQRSPVMATDLSDIAQQQRPQRQPRELAPRPAPRQASDFDFDTNDSLELTDEDLSPPVPGRSVQASGADPLLSSLFMNREAQEALGASGGAFDGGGGFDIGFDTEFDVAEGRGTPIQSARWQVGREDPPVMPFYREPTPRAGPSDGTVVSSRSANGTWQTRPAASAPRPASARPVGTPHVQRMVPNRLDFIRQAAAADPAPAVSAPAPRPAPRPVSASPGISRYDRIMGDD